MKGPGADARYWQALQAGRLEMQQCDQCGRWHWPAVWRCGECGSWEHSWHVTPLRGHIFSWTRTWHDFGAPAEFKPPFVSVVVELDSAGHRRVLGTLQAAADTEVRIGAAVVGAIGSVHVDGLELPGLRWQLTNAGNSSSPEARA